MAAARACSMRRLTDGSVSLARARSRAGSAAGSCELKTASAACRRVDGLVSNSCRLPIAASMAPRTALFRRTGLAPRASATAAPDEASLNEPSSALIRTVWSGVKYRRPFCSAEMIVAARGLPDSARSSTLCRVLSKPPAVKPANELSACAPIGRQSNDNSNRRKARRITVRNTTGGTRSGKVMPRVIVGIASDIAGMSPSNMSLAPDNAGRIRR